VRFHGSSAGPEGGYGHLTARLAGGRTAGQASIPAAVDPLATTCRLLGEYPTVKHNARVIRYQVPCRNNQQADQIRFICLCPMSCTFRIAVVPKIQSFLAQENKKIENMKIQSLESQQLGHPKLSSCLDILQVGSILS
jgi:hypothetical protein